MIQIKVICHFENNNNLYQITQFHKINKNLNHFQIMKQGVQVCQRTGGQNIIVKDSPNIYKFFENFGIFKQGNKSIPEEIGSNMTKTYLRIFKSLQFIITDPQNEDIRRGSLFDFYIRYLESVYINTTLSFIKNKMYNIMEHKDDNIDADNLFNMIFNYDNSLIDTYNMQNETNLTNLEETKLYKRIKILNTKFKELFDEILPDKDKNNKPIYYSYIMFCTSYSAQVQDKMQISYKPPGELNT